MNIIPRRSREVPVFSEPVPFDLHLEPTLNHRIPGKFGERALRELVDL
jgi:hypothetical protein